MCCAVQPPQAIQAVLLGMDAASGRVWLSMRQVLPDPLQETLDALLAEGPPSEPSGPPTDLSDPSLPVNKEEDGEKSWPLPDGSQGAENGTYAEETDAMVCLC